MVQDMPPAPAQVRELISAAAIATRVAALGQEIDRALPPGSLTVVGVLRGAFIFMSDLVRAIPREMTCEFLGVRSYGDATVSSGVVEITHDLMAPIAGRHVLLVEDIVDSGLTLSYLRKNLLARNPASLGVCALLVRDELVIDESDLTYVGFRISPQWVVGYGLDAGERYRNLREVRSFTGATG